MGKQARQQVIQCRPSGLRRAATSSMAQDLVRQDDVDRQPQPRVLPPRARDRRRPRQARVGDDDDAGRRAASSGSATTPSTSASRSAFVVTGLFREFEDASHPVPAHRHCLICACIDIGSNTTRLLVADAGDGRLRELVTQRAFTRIGKSLGNGAADPGREDRRDRRGGAHPGRRGAPRWAPSRSWRSPPRRSARAGNRAELVDAVQQAGGMELSILSGEEEARLSFVGATRTLIDAPAGTVAVIDVGGGSSEIAVGEANGYMTWSESFRIGSGFLADAYLRSDPPSADELGKVRRHVEGTFEGLEPPAGRQRRRGRRHGHVAAPAGRRRARARDARARHPRAVKHADRRGGGALRARPRAGAPAARRHPDPRGDLRPARRCRCGSRAAACARDCCWSWWRAGALVSPRRWRSARPGEAAR